MQTPATVDPLPLKAFGKALDRAPQRLGALRPSFTDSGLETLQARYRQDGYLWLKGLLDPGRVRDFRGWVLDHLGKAGTAPNAAQARMATLVRTARFEGFCAQLSLLDFIEAFIDAPAYLHPRKMMRQTHPGSGVSTAAHYDLIYLRGEPRSW